ncbi:hypothetical protein FOZ63_016452 [Perkinsus olseni]|uniref:Uncharacterized protein n=1 Tax=Perkinsus olseni TaxID=32597 RepID=A0A7J6N595_PEROL|nr:hypothetical protein FOZ63_016452 [Perkinsus olseni]
MSTYADRPSSASPSLRQSGLGQVTQLTRISQIRTSPKWTIGGRRSGESVSRGNMIPGPGQYRTTRLNDLGRGASFRFGTGRRDGDTRTRSDDGPGPGSYNPREVGSSAKVGFGSGRTSCGGASRRYSEPGPGHYNPPSSLGKTGKMFSMKSRHGPAGETSDAASMPGPGHYRLTGSSPQGSGPRWTFGTSYRSRLRRGDDTGPGPGAYAEHSRIGQNARKCGFGRPRPKTASLPGRGVSEGAYHHVVATILRTACFDLRFHRLWRFCLHHFRLLSPLLSTTITLV